MSPFHIELCIISGQNKMFYQAVFIWPESQELNDLFALFYVKLARYSDERVWQTTNNERPATNGIWASGFLEKDL